jgi:aldehyde:ferredoxin oxidoreductase
VKERVYGYAGDILRVDLTTSKVVTESVKKYTPKFLGGRGINQFLLFKELDRGVAPFEPANRLCIGAGVLTGTIVPGAARLNIDSKNALTGGIGSGNAGGWFAAELKFAGYDHIVIQGKAPEPAYLWIEDQEVMVKSAAALWGKSTAETEKYIRQELGQENLQLLCIGPAGENMVRSACIIVSGSRAVGRCGLGAVMGSKNLKAIAVKGNGAIEVKYLDEFMEMVANVSTRLRSLEGAKARMQFGTLSVSPHYNALSALAYKNYEDDYIPEDSLARISPEVFHNLYEVDRYACTACPVACGHTYRIHDGPYSGTQCRKAEANAVWNFGGKLAVDNATAILKAQEECCQLGLDIDNASSAIAWAIDCYQHELISKSDTDGMELNWGDHATILELLRKTAYREGFGNILAEGSMRASEMLGKDSEKYAFHIKGQDLIEAIRSMKGWALGVVVSARGGAHTRGALATESRRYSEEDSERLFGIKTAGNARAYRDKPRVVRYFEHVHALLDSLGVCFFTGNWSMPDGMNPEELARLYFFATGDRMTEGNLVLAGERIHNVEKMFNVYHAGFTRKDDYPPRRLMEEPIKSGPLKGELLRQSEWDQMLDSYYSLHGWDQVTGWPTEEKLYELDLPECISRLQEAKRIYQPEPS